MMIAFAANVSVHIGETIKRNKHCERETIWLSSMPSLLFFVLFAVLLSRATWFTSK